MVTIELQDLGKRYNRHWIFRHLNYTFYPGIAYAITGANGSGKSTLLQVLAGAITLSEGKILMTTADGQQQHNSDKGLAAMSQPPAVMATENHYQNLSIAAPYLELIEEMTLTELLQFHFQFKPALPGYTIKEIIEYVQLATAAHRQIRHYSSGMKQRVKLAQAIFSNVPVVLLDEPLTNLDTRGTNLYYQLVENFCQNRLLIICSNSEPEIHFCKQRLAVDQFTHA